MMPDRKYGSQGTADIAGVTPTGPGRSPQRAAWVDQGRSNVLRKDHSSSTEHWALQRELCQVVTPTKFSPDSSTGKITKFSELCYLQLGNRATYGHCHENFR